MKLQEQVRAKSTEICSSVNLNVVICTMGGKMPLLTSRFESLSLRVSADHISFLLLLSDFCSVSEIIPKMPRGTFLSLDVHYL